MNRPRCRRANSQTFAYLASALIRRGVKLFAACAVTAAVLTGCATTSYKRPATDFQYCDDCEGVSYYRSSASKIAWPCLDNQTAQAVAVSVEPRNLGRRIDDEPREVSLHDVIHIALSHNRVIESSALGGIGSKAILNNPSGVATVYDPAIQASGVLFGRRSVESALADFDANFTTALTWRRNDLSLQSGSVLGNGNRADFTSSLSKQFATGGSVSLNHDWVHTSDPATIGPFTPNYFGRIGLSVRQPLLAGSGVDYTRIAGPANPNFGAITGVSQGVVIARINEDVSVANFQLAVRNAVRDITNQYWALYFAYRTWDTAVVAHKSAFQTWRESHDRYEVGDLAHPEELQTRDRLYETKATVETSLNTLFKAEAELRRLIGLPMNDGTVLRPSDDPILAEVIPDWRASLEDALVHRVELRRQKWSVKSLQLQLQAARSLVRPRLDFIAGYDINGMGDRLLSTEELPFRNAYRSMGTDDTNNWNAGFQLSVPVGQRFSRSQVRNLELQVAKATAILASQEKNIAHDVTTAIQDLTATYAAAQSNRKRLEAATLRVEKLQQRKDLDDLTLDLVLRARASQATAENAYYQQVVDYNIAIMQLQFSCGTLLQDNGIFLAEGQWEPDAYCDALLRAKERTHAKDAPYLEAVPAPFASPGPTGTLNLHTPPAHAEEVIPELSPSAPDDGARSEAATRASEAPRAVVPLPPQVASSPYEADPPVRKSPRAAYVEPEPIYDPLRSEDRKATRAASSELSDFPSLDIFQK